MEQKTLWSRFVKTFLDHNLLRMVLVVMVLLRSCPFLSPIVGPCVKITLFWSVGILIYDLITRKLLLKNRFRGILYLFLIAYGITVLVNWRMNFARNVVMLGYMCINMMVIYAYDVQESAEKARRDLLRFNLTFILTSFIGQTISFITFILNLRFTFQIGEQTFFYGITNGRLWAFYNNPNAASFIAVISIMITTVTVLVKRKAGLKGWNVLYVLNIIIEFIILFLSNSRGSLLMMTIYLVFLPILCSLSCLSDRDIRKETMKKSLAMALLLPLALSGAHEYSMSVLPSIVISSSAVNKPFEGEIPGISKVEDDEELELNEDGEVELERHDYGAKYGGRYYLWRAGLKLIEHHPVFGVASDNVPYYTTEYARQYFTEEGKEPYLPGVASGLHNLFFQIAAASGLLGLAIFLVFGIMVIVRVMRFFIRSVKDHKYDASFGAMLLVAAVILLRTMTDTGIIYGVYYLGIVFWMYMSQIMRVIDLTYPEDKPDMLARISDRIFAKAGKRGSH